MVVEWPGCCDIDLEGNEVCGVRLVLEGDLVAVDPVPCEVSVEISGDLKVVAFGVVEWSFLGCFS